MSDITKLSPSRAWQWLGLTVVDSGDGYATVEMTATEDMANQSGFVHGGMISALADSAMGRSLRTIEPGVARAMSFDLKLSFVNAAKIGETLRATGRVIHAGQAVLLEVGLAGQAVGADLVRLEDGAGLVVVGLQDRVEHVVVAAGAADGHALEGHEGVLDRVLQPLLAAEQLEVADQETGGAEGGRVGRCLLIRRQHLDDHPVIALIRIQ